MILVIAMPCFQLIVAALRKSLRVRISIPTFLLTKLPFKCHPHMLRHATGYVLANKGTDTRTLQSYLGHRSIQSTVRYSELAPGRFKSLWR